jgi:hypothetical protein
MPEDTGGDGKTREEREIPLSERGVEIIQVKDPKGDPSKIGTLPAPEAGSPEGDGARKE